MGIELPAASPANPSIITHSTADATQKATQSPKTDPLAAFVASLSPDQKAKLAALLANTPAGSSP